MTRIWHHKPSDAHPVTIPPESPKENNWGGSHHPAGNIPIVIRYTHKYYYITNHSPTVTTPRITRCASLPARSARYIPDQRLLFQRNWQAPGPNRDFQTKGDGWREGGRGRERVDEIKLEVSECGNDEWQAR